MPLALGPKKYFRLTAGLSIRFYSAPGMIFPIPVLTRVQWN
jgi:hypothetical protein